MFEDREDEKNIDFNSQLKRFEEMLKAGKSSYFDVEIFEEIIDHYLGLNEYKKALRGIDAGLAQHPGNSNLMLLKADLYLSTGKLLKSLECLSAIETIEPYNSEVFVLKASVYSQQRKFDEAIYYLKLAIKYCEQDEKVELYIDLAVEYENCEKYEKAISCLKHALELNAENETAMYEISYCYEIAGKNAESIAFYQAFIDEHPYSFLAWHNLGTSLIKDGNLPEALDCFDYCLAINEEFSTAHFNKATVLMMNENYYEAINHFNETVIREEALPLTFLYLGECYEKINESVLAEQHFMRALEIDEEFADAYVSLALLKANQNQYTEADFYISKAVKLDDQNPDFWYIKAEICENDHRANDAKAAYQNAIQLNPDNLEILLDFSNFLHADFSLEDALFLLESVYEKFAGVDLIEFRISALCFLSGKIQTAGEFFVRGLEYNNQGYKSAFQYCPDMQTVPLFNDLIAQYNNGN